MSEETFACLLEPNLQAIRRFVRAKMRTPGQAEDVVQETLLRAFVHRDQLRTEARFRSWLWSIAVNEIRGYHRRTRIHVTVDDLPGNLFCDRNSCPHKAYVEKERSLQLQAAMANLSARDRTAIRLIDLCEMKVNEAAQRLSVSAAAFKSTHFRARRRLGEAMIDRTNFRKEV